MKLLMKSLLCSLVLSLMIQMLTFSAQCHEIENNVFRLHIIANSDNKYDQQLKLCVRDRILLHTKEMYSHADNTAQARLYTTAELNDIERIAQRTVHENGYDYTVKAEVSNIYFPTREYENYTLPAGNYDALRIIIGEGKGHNWWCVMFPSLCLPSAEKSEDRENYFSNSQKNIVTNGVKYKYKFKIVELFESIRCRFSDNSK